MIEKENIIHIDMDAFFAAIEQMDNPELKDKPVAVCGRKDSRGVISTASYEARKFGVHSAMSVKSALQKCPSLILIEARFERYIQISDALAEIFYKYTPVVERASIDEAYLDVKASHLLFGTTIEIARKIKKEIKEQFGLSCSVGISINKLIAKIASDYRKPDGFTVVREEQINNFLDKLKIEKLPGLGPKTAKSLNMRGIYYIKELKEMKLETLIKLFGLYGERIYFIARGIDNSPVVPDELQEEKSISNEITLDYDTTDEQLIHNTLLKLSDKVSARLRAKDLKGRTLKLKVKFFDFKTCNRQISLENFTNQSNEIYKNIIKLLNTIEDRPIRLLGVGVSNFNKHNTEQLTLFKNDKSIDLIKDKYGEKLINRATFL